ncbi:hypothetical protein SAY86_018625 [Trapa natans]|uniref:Uncharacterized protein n=1 Tax=Trapa natans TaxID=22666 RepID=A0AAN7LD22_TRANT|nr:hypothetical protein SAY86_018625 [Trapa natans]
MDMRQGQKYGSPSSSWTDEKHLKFLDSVEATFIRTMLHGSNSSHHPPLPLDRHMPDSSESTQDLKSQRRKKLQPTGGSRAAGQSCRLQGYVVEGFPQVQRREGNGISDLE